MNGRSWEHAKLQMECLNVDEFLNVLASTTLLVIINKTDTNRCSGHHQMSVLGGGVLVLAFCHKWASVTSGTGHICQKARRPVAEDHLWQKASRRTPPPADPPPPGGDPLPSLEGIRYQTGSDIIPPANRMTYTRF